jgi:hypothetical protein
VDRNPQFPEAADMMPDHALSLWFVEHWRLSVLERLSGFQRPIDQRQHRMRDGNQRRRLLAT